MVGKRLCSEPSENHWKLRDQAAELVATICARFGQSYDSLQPRITKTLLSAFVNPARPLTTHYGAIVALTKLGPHTIQKLVLPNLKAYMTRLQPEQEASDPIKRQEATKCFSALLECVGIYIRRYWSLFDSPLHSQHRGPSLPQGSGDANTKKRKSPMSNYKLPTPKSTENSDLETAKESPAGKPRASNHSALCAKTCCITMLLLHRS